MVNVTVSQHKPSVLSECILDMPNRAHGGKEMVRTDISLVSSMEITSDCGFFGS